LYVVGGYSDGSNINILEAYDTETNTWTTKEPMPTTRRNVVTGFDNTKAILYAVGGQDDNDNRLGTMEAYYVEPSIFDVETNTWTTKEPMPTARSQLAAEFDNTNGILYALGGGVGGGVDILAAYYP
jgi:hypothetical protein